MGGFAFLVMLGGFAALVYWYIANLEHGEDGGFGFLGLKEAETPGDEAATVETKEPVLKGSDAEEASYDTRHGKSYDRQD